MAELGVFLFDRATSGARLTPKSLTDAFTDDPLADIQLMTGGAGSFRFAQLQRRIAGDVGPLVSSLLVLKYDSVADGNPCL
ncbi:hypothetical protein [Mesorhizobium australicum]|uniref:hypothetical protein n=1 Tax=Mesorhizobium australicum TaxID=536018 RepID=UPI00333D753E